MKLIKKSIYALSLLSVMGLWSCSNEEMLPDVQEPQGKPVSVTLTVNRGEAQTRTELSENTVTGGLDSKWEEGDKLYVHGSNGKEIGTLTLKEGATTSVGIFEGEVTVDAGPQELNVWYYNKDKAGSYFNFVETSTKTTLKVILNEQSFTSASDLAAVEVMGQKVKVNVIGTTATVVESTEMLPKLAMAKFSLKGLPESTTGHLMIYDADKKAAGTEASTLNTLDLNLSQPTVKSPGASTTGTLTDKKYAYNFAGVKAGEDIYVALLPRANKIRYGFEFTTTDNQVYTYEFSEGTLIEAGKYYNAGLDNGSVKGTEIILTPVGGNAEVVDHSKNPLAKWAETNLVYNEATDKSEFASSSSVGGSLYQWGRNHGYIDYKDARGNREEINGYNNYPYVVVGEDRDGETHTGMGIELKYGGTYITDSFYMLSKNDLSTLKKECTKMFVMNGSFDNNNRDYWIFGTGGGDDWNSRAKACGYADGSLIDNDWRLPTVEEFNQILPSGLTISELSDKLSSKLEDYMEIREDKSGKYKYAICWKSSVTGLVIKALVVPDTYSDSDKSKVDWTDDNVITRTFPFTGAIVADHREGVCSGNAYISRFTDYIAGPIPMLGVTTQQKLVSLSKNDIYGSKWYAACLIYNFPTVDYAKQCLGVYWTSTKEALMFTDKEYYSGINSNIVVSSLAPHNAFAIRCVKNESTN